MRLGLFLTLALAIGGCGSDNAGNGNDLAMSGVQDLSAGGGGGGGTGGGDMAGTNPVDGFVITDGGVAGTTCTSACDCMPGLGCFAGKCAAATNPIYCCGSTSCPSGDICQSMNGTYGRCGFGSPDLAAFDVCPYINCNGATGTTRCMQSGCTSCVAGTGGTMSCAK